MWVALGTFVEALLGVKRGARAVKKGRGVVSEPRFLISAFLKDFFGEINTFGGPEGAQGGAKSLQSLPAQVRNDFQMSLDSRIHFWAFPSALASSLGRSLPFRRPGPSAQGFRPLLLQK